MDIKRMNETLRFSWGHIIAFLALIAVSYVSFVGFTYLTGADFTCALAGMIIIDLVYMLVFIGAQQLKASGSNPSLTIKFERILIFSSPVVFIIGMIPMSQFWTAVSHNDEIVTMFTESINGSKQLFADYEVYSEQRQRNYEMKLNEIIVNSDSNMISFGRAGFRNDAADIQKNNMVETLRLQLLSENYYNLKTAATAWIDAANNGASVWNVFLLGNTREIKEALVNWEEQLESFSRKKMSNEALTGGVPEFTSSGASTAYAGIDNLNQSFTKSEFPKFTAILFGIIIYAMLLMPYCIQDRHAKSIYTLFGTERSKSILNIGKQDKNVDDNPYPMF